LRRPAELIWESRLKDNHHREQSSGVEVKMPKSRRPTQEQLDKAAKLLYHHVDCKQFKELRIRLTEKGQAYKKHLAILGLSSKETVGAGLKAVDASPFKTVFVVDEESGGVLFALSKNEEYVEAAKKKRPKPGPTPTPTPTSECCQLCAFKGGTSCQPLSDGSCICFGADRGDGGGGGDLDDQLEVLAS
jgi:hypothetical protein